MSQRENQCSNGHSGRLPSWDWASDPETVAWRARIDAWIEEQRTYTEPAFHCIPCGSDVPLSELIARRRIS